MQQQFLPQTNRLRWGWLLFDFILSRFAKDYYNLCFKKYLLDPINRRLLFLVRPKPAELAGSYPLDTLAART